MNIALIGATGYVGSKLLAEALDRGHRVTAIARDTGKLESRPHLTATSVDVLDTDGLAALLKGHDAVISAYRPKGDDKGPRSIVDAVTRAGVPRLLVVGGAGSLQLPNGSLVIDDPGFPAEWKSGAMATAAFLDLLRAEQRLEWTFLSPAAHLEPGRRTGTYRTGGDQLLVDANGNSRISVEDYAVAMLDEVERPAHARQRFTAAY